MDEPQKQYAKGKKPDTKEPICKNYPEKWAGFTPVSSPMPITFFTAWSSSFS